MEQYHLYYITDVSSNHKPVSEHEIAPSVYYLAVFGTSGCSDKVSLEEVLYFYCISYSVK